MPKMYESMRDKFAAEGMSYDDAQAKAARIYNSKHPNAPVGAHSESKPKRKRSRRPAPLPYPNKK